MGATNKKEKGTRMFLNQNLIIIYGYSPISSLLVGFVPKLLEIWLHTQKHSKTMKHLLCKIGLNFLQWQFVLVIFAFFLITI